MQKQLLIYSPCHLSPPTGPALSDNPAARCVPAPPPPAPQPPSPTAAGEPPWCRPSRGSYFCSLKLAGCMLAFPWISGRAVDAPTRVGTGELRAVPQLSSPRARPRGERRCVRGSVGGVLILTSLGEAQSVLMERRWQAVWTEVWPVDPILPQLWAGRGAGVDILGTLLCFGPQCIFPAEGWQTHSPWMGMCPFSQTPHSANRSLPTWPLLLFPLLVMFFFPCPVRQDLIHP